MAALDAYIQQLFDQGGSELVFEAGSGAYLRTPLGVQPVLRQPLTTQQILGAFAEILPDDLKLSYPVEGLTRFVHPSPAGLTTVRLEKRGMMVRAFVAPGEEQAATDQADAAKFEPSRGQSWAWSPAPKAEKAEKSRSVVEKRALPRDPRAAMEALLESMHEQRASDLHLSSSCPPMMRIDGSMKAFEEFGELSSERLAAILLSITPDRNRAEFEQTKDTDFAHETEKARFRVNLFADRNGIGSVMRLIPNRILSAEELGLSPAILQLCTLSKGLVVVTGPTGSGKSTTLAAMVDHINRTRDDHIITIEDPIEFVHPNKRCLINQREIGVNTASFRSALRAALREDPDIVLVGEMRDLETVEIALETAETGHLVFGTLHTNTAPATIDRIIDQFPADRQQQVRTMLAESLKGVIAQTLCKKIGGGRAAALEVLLCNSAVSNLVREGKTFQLASVMQTGRAQGMVMLNDALFDLVKRRLVSPNDAYLKAVHKNEFKEMLERGGFQLK